MSPDPGTYPSWRRWQQQVEQPLPMDPAPISKALQLLASKHPAAHPYTLALLRESRTGVRISGARARELLAAPTSSRG